MRIAVHGAPSPELGERRRLFNALAASHAAVPGTVDRVLGILEADPLASAGAFPGDLVRRLMELPSAFWSRHPDLYARYRSAVRAAALARRGTPGSGRRGFWRDLPARID